jgi:hypothetical protein
LDSGDPASAVKSRIRNWPRAIASRVFLIAGILCCVWILVNIITLIVTMGPIGLVFVLLVLPYRGGLALACFALARTVPNGRYLGAAIALATCMLWSSAIFMLSILLDPGPAAHIAAFAINYTLSASLILLALTAMWCTIAAYKDVRQTQTT